MKEMNRLSFWNQELFSERWLITLQTFIDLSPEIFEKLALYIVQNQNEYEVMNCCKKLGQSNSQEALRLLQALVELDFDEWIAASALDAIGNLAFPSSIPFLLEWATLADKQHTQQTSPEHLLGQWNNAGNESFDTMDNISDVIGISCSAIRSIGKCGSSSHISVLKPFLDSELLDIRVSTQNAMQILQNKEIA